MTKKRQTFPVMFSGSTLSGDDGEIEGYVFVAQNITELKRVKEKLKKVEGTIATKPPQKSK